MFENLLFVTLLATFYTFVPTYFFHQLFPFRFESKVRFSIQMICSFILLLSFNYIKLLGYAAETTTLIQLTIFLNIYLLFKGSTRQKVLIYFIFLFVSIFIEMLSVNIYLQLYILFTQTPSYTALNIFSHSSFQEKLFIQLLIFVFNWIVYRKIFSLLQECLPYLKLSLLLQIIFPFFLPLIATEFKSYYSFASSLIPVLIYIASCILSLPLFMHGIHRLKMEQIKFNQTTHKVELLKKQLELSNEMKDEYARIRKWNHDIENHLLSLSYLIDTQKTEEAHDYCASILKENIRP